MNGYWARLLASDLPRAASRPSSPSRTASSPNAKLSSGAAAYLADGSSSRSRSRGKCGALKGQRGFFTRDDSGAVVGVDLAGRLFTRLS